MSAADAIPTTGRTGGPESQDALEARYRRLLAWYPRDHRATHEEEMIGVLLAGAHPGQGRPGVRDALDLLHGGLRLRARRAFGRGRSGPWQDALAVTGAIGLLLALAKALAFTSGRAMTLVTTGGGIQLHPPADLVWLLLPPLLSAIALAASAANLRRVTSAAAWGLVAMAVWGLMATDMWPVTGVADGGGFVVRVLPQIDGWSYVAVVTALALTFCRTPRRGLTLLGARRLLPWTFVVFATLIWNQVMFWLPTPVYGMMLIEDLPFIAAAFVASGLALRSPVGRRSAALLTVPLAVHLATSAYTTTWADGWPMGVLMVLVPAVVLAVLARRALRLDHASRPSPAPAE
ncbi:hypothetical protein [Sphaerisporangium aureirubrum]|uniref:Uncharacterized protein n=1 Tax=Sphaerisporangium aureirubrum TaxID=1544736 RepID=A0ABW1N9X0_9ACTN